MASAPSDLAVIALTGPDRAGLSRGAEAVGVRVAFTTDLAGFLERLREEDWLGSVVSIDVEHVDEAVVARVVDHPGSGAVLLSAHQATLDLALMAERVGALGILREPFDAEEVTSKLGGVVDEGDVISLPMGTEGERNDSLLGSSASMQTVIETIARVAASRGTVLITGESGTGKEMVARTLHQSGDRSAEPFVPVNCAAIPDALLESELFGHEKGAFTGAIARRTGRFARAHRGTLFLDEIGDMSPVLQAKVLRVLEDGSVEPVGSEEAISVDARLIAATNRDLERRIEEGLFREDLYHRLSVIEIDLPPLRDRLSDLMQLTEHLVQVAAARHERAITGVTSEAVDRLHTYSWPGNVRELRNVLDRAVILARGEVIRAADLRLGEGSPHRGPRGGAGSASHTYPVQLSLAEVEAEHIRRVLEASDGHMSRAAETLGIHRNTLTRKVQEYGLDQVGGA